MTTVLMPLDPSVSPQQAARVLSIRADLLPPEIRDGRRARRTRGLILVSLTLVLALLGSWYWVAIQDLNDARAENNDAFVQLTDVQRAQQRDPEVQTLIKSENGTALLTKELKAVLVSDLSWANLLDLIRDRAVGEKVTVREISASLDDDVAAGATSVGTLTVTGRAANKKVVAGYVDALSTDIEDVSNPFVSSISNTDDGVSFSITVTITKEALCGRLVDEDHACPSEGK
ncbi:PilN domain-containing protein [Actinoplanes sp. DH11]|uniref:PilN domain-containing protein n=1 Tax=Actinoplanes sp. DH11 TaxID=2857011 RepID=UPI001E470518|nr:PilN domain-containing protein [Actinoplanes sp. DH11]